MLQVLCTTKNPTLDTRCHEVSGADYYCSNPHPPPLISSGSCKMNIEQYIVQFILCHPRETIRCATYFLPLDLIYLFPYIVNISIRCYSFIYFLLLKLFCSNAIFDIHCAQHENRNEKKKIGRIQKNRFFSPPFSIWKKKKCTKMKFCRGKSQ